ncbi:MAG: HAMP domain-containing protein [Gammaproteobacteria bacterium]|nr:MAG: HAMP domain-containing protein [Gammaproteobacteria bacterium]
MSMGRQLLVGLLLATLLLISLILLGQAGSGSESFGRVYTPLLLVNLAALLLIFALIVRQLRHLVRQVRAQVPGARLTLRMASAFFALSLLPLLLVYGYSLHVIRAGIDNWFDLRVEQALEDALELSQAALDLRMRELLQQTEKMAEQLEEPAPGPLTLDLGSIGSLGDFSVENTLNPAAILDRLRSTSSAEELAIYDDKGHLLASSSAVAEVVPDAPDGTILLQLRQGRSYIGLEPAGQGLLQVRVVVRVPSLEVGAGERLLQAIYPISQDLNRRAEAVQQSYAKYRELAYLRPRLKLSYTLTLTLVLLLAAFGAVWAGILTARRLIQPIRELAAGTESVASGDLETRLPQPSRRDELGFLVRSFNQMTESLAEARDQARRSQEQIQAQHAYLQAILERLSTGVMALDGAGRIRTVNPAVENILRVPQEALTGHDPGSIAARHPELEPFLQCIADHLAAGDHDWQEQVELYGGQGHQTLLLRGTVLDTAGGGHVLVFDDITALIQGQRDAAWSEVARRLAHEIKNPLTPIQLSAERLRQKYLKGLPEEQAELFDRLTRTIVQQVEALKGMVNEFSEYARSPKLHPAPVEVNELLEGALELFRSSAPGAGLDAALQPGLPPVVADAARLRQVFNNLLKNALEAAGPEARIRVESRLVETGHTSFVEVRIRDNGPGIEEQRLARVFEPYVTDKPRGTGLGLAIVKKIVEEHNGAVWLESGEGGTCAVVRLPAVTANLPTLEHSA